MSSQHIAQAVSADRRVPRQGAQEHGQRRTQTSWSSAAASPVQALPLDAATRGLRTGIAEAGDWAAGTSAWSSKLVHGGLRYLYNLDFKLVTEAPTERGLLLNKIAPTWCTHSPSCGPLKMPVIERAYPHRASACTTPSHSSLAAK